MARYLEGSSQVQDPTPAVRELDALTTKATAKDGRTVAAFNPLSRNDWMIFEVLLLGEHALHGFTNRDLRQKLAATSYPLVPELTKKLLHFAPTVFSTCSGWEALLEGSIFRRCAYLREIPILPRSAKQIGAVMGAVRAVEARCPENTP
jgi:hypothetical protein